MPLSCVHRSQGDDTLPTQETAKALSLFSLIENDLNAVNALIQERMQSPVSLIPQLANHLISSGGKRLRPMLALASARLCGYQGQDHITLATCVEFIHSATLLHDDVVDESTLRRGVPSASQIWGNQASVLVGDFLFSRAFQLMVEVGSLEILSILSSASAHIAQGEVLQLMTVQDIATTQEKYLEIILSKTAKLFEAASEIGPVLAGRPDTERHALTTYGRNLGIAFQLVDDALDYGLSSSPTGLGKNPGDDFKEGKITLPVVYALENSTEEDQQFWHRTLGELKQKQGDFQQAIAYMHKTRALERTLQKASFYAREAEKSLACFPDTLWRQGLEELTHFTVKRCL